MNRKKIINDPVYGFITIPNSLVFDLINHPYFQRLRRIRQTGLTEFVYPGAVHTRFHHAIGAMHLMKVALSSLQEKGVYLYEEEIKGALVAILLHDIGHGPFSHSLEGIILPESHEELSKQLMNKLNREFNGELSLGIQIFNKSYPRKFLNQLVSSQLDVDRLDYLLRDSFYTGVAEGKIGADRIIKMLNIVDDELIVEEKGIYSIENFLNARRLMYWQVYLHKTSVSAELMLKSIFKRAKLLLKSSSGLQATNQSLIDLLSGNTSDKLSDFLQIDDFDVWSTIKLWSSHQDNVLSILSRRLLNRDLLKIDYSGIKINKSKLKETRSLFINEGICSEKESKYLIQSGEVTNSAYISNVGGIKIKLKSGAIEEVESAVDLPNIKAITKIVKKYYLTYPKSL